MKQQNLKEIPDFQMSPKSSHEYRKWSDRAHMGDISFEGEITRTKQSEAEACDINNIMKRYEATGFLPDTNGRTPMYGDFSTQETFQEALAIVSNANSLFHALPADIRAKFSNDPAQFLGYVEKGYTDEKVAKELVEMGLAQVRDEKPDKILADIRENTKAKPNKTKQQADSAASNEE